MVQKTKQILIDRLGVTLAALTDKGKIIASLGKKLEGPPESSMIGLGDKVSVSNAAFANGELMIFLALRLWLFLV
jgi:2-methylcitrate dehydratase PrpD